MNMPQCASDLLAYLAGSWTFTRQMQSLDGASIGKAQGQAQFDLATAAATLHYHETGQLQLQAEARAISFSRRFDYQLQDDLWQVSFADGPQAGQAYQRYRYDAGQRALLPEEIHVCLQDHYDGSYRLLDEACFTLQTRIEGPHKAYLLLSRFSRAQATLR
jgi:hypothetical protein